MRLMSLLIGLNPNALMPKFRLRLVLEECRRMLKVC